MKDIIGGFGEKEELGLPEVDEEGSGGLIELSIPGAARQGSEINVVANGNSGKIYLPGNNLLLYVNLKTLTGGSAPTLQLFIDESFDGGITFRATPLGSGAALNAVGDQRTVIAGPYSDWGRVRWVITGAPTAIDFVWSLVGR